MYETYSKLRTALNHLIALHEVFMRDENFGPGEKRDRALYAENESKLREALRNLGFDHLFYGERGRQMILADFLEYIFFGRGYLAVRSSSVEDRSNFMKAILYFVNLLMSYEVTTVSNTVRRAFLRKLSRDIPQVGEEQLYNQLIEFSGTVGLKRGESEAPEELNRYFDTLLPKTAGGLWHELLVYVFLLRNDCGYIIPLVICQRLLGFQDHLVPPDFLIIGYDKRIYGVEVGTKKEIQSGSFSLRTAIPTATVDTENSRTSDRCPICKRWIQFCPFVIDKYSKLDEAIPSHEVRCLEQCTIYKPEDIASGLCQYTKYRRNRAETLKHTHHDFTDGLHYHLTCVLDKVPAKTKQLIIDAQDKIALKTHFPYYGGLEELINTTRKQERPSTHKE